MKLSVIVPVYNGEVFLKQCINSIINQTYRDLELVVVDDGSIDNTASILAEYEKKDPRVKVIHQENKGICGAVITGLENAQGDYISFCDADDFCELNKYEILMQKALEYDCDMVTCGIKSDTGLLRISKAKEGLYSDKDLKKLYKNIFLFGGFCVRYNKVVKREFILNNLDIYKMCKKSINEDYYFFTSFFFDLKRIYIIHDPLCNVRIVENVNSTTKKQKSDNFEIPYQFYEDMKKIYAIKHKEKYLKQIHNFIFQAYKAQIVIINRSNTNHKVSELRKLTNDKLFRHVCYHTSWKNYPNKKESLRNTLLQILVILRFNYIISKA